MFIFGIFSIFIRPNYGDISAFHQLLPQYSVREFSSYSPMPTIIMIILSINFDNSLKHNFSALLLLLLSSRCSQWNTRQDDELTYTENEATFIHSDMCHRGAIDSLDALSFRFVVDVCLAFATIVRASMGAVCVCVCVRARVCACVWDRNIYLRSFVHSHAPPLLRTCSCSM